MWLKTFYGRIRHGATPPAQKRNAYCSFCRKSYCDVGPLVEGPDEVISVVHASFYPSTFLMRNCTGEDIHHCSKNGKYQTLPADLPRRSFL